MPTTQHAAGTVDVTVSPQPASSPTPGAALGRMLLDKRYHGDLDATAQGQMLSAGTVTTGSAGYVAIEHVVGRLHGKSGSFVLQHSGTMTRGKGELCVSVVPDSGTGELKGLSGRMTIEISDGNHSYGFDYSLEDAP